MKRFNRRMFLKASSLSMIALGAGGTPPFLRRLVSEANAAPIQTRRKTLVTIFQRGAMDGLMAVSPAGDPGLAAMRPRLAVDSGLIDVGEGYRLHPALAPFEQYYNEGNLAIVHGVGSPNKTRSHFDAQDYMETGTPFRKGTSSGWLNRAVGELGHDATPFRAVALTPRMPLSLYGTEPSIAVADLREFSIRGGRRVWSGTDPARGFESLYEDTSVELLRGTGEDSFSAIATLAELDVANYRPSVDYPNSPLGRSLQQIAFLIKMQVGLEVAFAESGGWDTHVQQGTNNGVFAARAGDLSRSIAAFWTDVGEFRDDVTLMTMTEFGRTVHENGSGGTDHGRASCMFVLGNSVAGGRVHGSIPSLRPDDLEDGRDLPVTVDFRRIFAEVAGSHLAIDNDAALFPDWDGQRYALMEG